MNKLTITSSNADHCGTWTKNEVLREMDEVGVQCNPKCWIEWLFVHNFDEFPAELVEFLNCDVVMNAKFEAVIDGCIVKISAES